MKKRGVTYSLIIVLVFLALFLVARWQEPRKKEVFDRHPARLSFSALALCRMNCGHISQDEIRELMEKGIILFHRSNRYGRPCPVFVLQGHTRDGERLSARFLQCRTETNVVNCEGPANIVNCPCGATTSAMNVVIRFLHHQNQEHAPAF